MKSGRDRDDQLALVATGLNGSRQQAWLLSDNGSSWVAGATASNTYAKPNHPITQGKIERWHQTVKNGIYFLPGDLEAKVGIFVDI